MNHTEAIAKLPEYIDNELSDEEYYQVEEHIEDCEACQEKIYEPLAKESQLSRFTDEEILRLVRAGYILSDKKEQELRQCFQTLIVDSLPPYHTNVLQGLPLAADQGKARGQLEEIKRQVGLEWAEKRLRLSFSKETTYWGRLEIHDIQSAYLVFEKDGQETSDLDGVEIEFYNKDAHDKTLNEQVEEDFVLLDFGKLNLSIRDYERVGFRLSFSDKTIELSFAEME
ncbi:zf-HC2 domain-containing protein [bacterium]|nr:zf-HC2 domain-containing protein [bacterium]